MRKRNKSVIAASLITVIFMFLAIRPGILNMIGYTISLLIFPENSEENIKYGKTIVYIFDILCGVLVFWGVYKISNRIFK